MVFDAKKKKKYEHIKLPISQSMNTNIFAIKKSFQKMNTKLKHKCNQ